MAAIEVLTIDDRRCRRTTHVAPPDDRGVDTEIDSHALVEYVQRPLPQPFVAVGLAVSNDSALDLIDLRESAIEHRRAEDLASHPARAVRHDRLALEVVVLATVEFGDEIMSRSNVGNDRVFELPDSGLERVPSVEKHHIVTAFRHEVVHLSGGEVLPPVENTGFADDYLVGGRERDEFRACLDAQPREIITRSL